jgi:hypothetical protein|nr:MAG TPA: hypothetical protein [Caudoviricetes sp.]
MKGYKVQLIFTKKNDVEEIFLRFANCGDNTQADIGRVICDKMKLYGLKGYILKTVNMEEKEF